MKDLEFGHPAGDPLPERLKQYLSDMARRELEMLRADLEAKLIALERALARPDQHDSLETLVLDLARAATIEAEAAASRAMLDAHMPGRQGGASDTAGEPDAGRATVLALRNELEDLRRRSENDAARMQIEHDELADRLAAAEREAQAVRQALDGAQREMDGVRRDARDARHAADARAADVAKGREAAGAAQVEAAARLKTVEDKVKAAEAARAEAERMRRDAVSRAETAEVYAREMAARASNAEAWGKDLETRFKETEVRYGKERETSAEREKEHESLTGRVSDRDALAQRVVEQKETIDRLETTIREYEQRLTAADERDKLLELQLFKRGNLEPSRDEDLSGLLMMPGGGGTRPVRIATRYAIGGAVRIEVGGHAGVLVDLSTYGAQVLSSAPVDEGADVELRIVSDELAAVCRGRIVWTKVEPASAPGGLRHRGGIAFTYRDVGAIEAFIIRYAST
jgi:hypothetical protein